MSATPANAVPAQRARSRRTRWLHLLLAAVIVHQMVMSAIMQIPNPRRGHPGNVWWDFHQYGGLTSFVILLAFWVWSLRRSAAETGFGDWFPWFSAARLRALWRDVTDYAVAIRRRRLPQPGVVTPLASMVQGLGLLLVTFMSVSGTLLWIAARLGGDWPSRAHALANLHGTLGNVVWYYLGIHAGAAVAHEFFGHRLLRPMSPLR